MNTFLRETTKEQTPNLRRNGQPKTIQCTALPNPRRRPRGERRGRRLRQQAAQAQLLGERFFHRYFCGGALGLVSACVLRGNLSRPCGKAI